MLLSRPSEQLAPQKPHHKAAGTPWARSAQIVRALWMRALKQASRPFDRGALRLLGTSGIGLCKSTS